MISAVLLPTFNYGRDTLRATAARSGLDSLSRVKEIFDIEARLRRLEEVAGSEKK